MDPWHIVAVIATSMTTVVGILWRLHVQADADDRKDRDGWRGIAETALGKLAELTAAVVELSRTVGQLRSEVRRLQELVRDLGGKP